MKTTIPQTKASLGWSFAPPVFLPIILAIVCFALVHTAQAVNPPPEGGYPNFTTAEGVNALQNLTTGAGNTAVGWYSLFTGTTGSFNTGVGAGALVLNTGDEDTAVGTAALLLNTASGNTAMGSRALLNNTTGGTIGNVSGYDVGPNVAVGSEALESNTLAGGNTAVGYQALRSFITGPVGSEQVGLCTAVGFQALGNATAGPGNSAFGYQALINNTDGSGNTAIGLQALFNNSSGDGNIAVGVSALFSNTIGRWNVANGSGALSSNVTGQSNIAIGQQAMESNISGSFNTAVGFEALPDNTNGSHNIAVGDGVGVNVMTADRVICIGAVGDDISNSCYIGQIFNATCIGGSAVFIDSNNKLGTITSSKRFKDEIKPMGQVSETLFALKPVTFRYKKEIDPIGTSQFGLVAEEVERVNSDLVVRDKEGKPYSVRYEQVNAMLLNEFLKEHKTVQEQGTTIADLKKEIASLTTTVKEQAAQIQKVRAQVEVSKPIPRIVANHQ
jgi:trimeric autotransporter adhesin